jgi:biphenyl-2,3-diol 1,2-dioxygenase
MSGNLQLGYLVIDATDLDAWHTYMTRELGVMPGRSVDGERNYRLDTRQMRFQIQAADVDDVAVIGLVATTAEKYAEFVVRLERSGVSLERGDDKLRELRRVAELVSFTAPGGVRVELAHGQRRAIEPFFSPVVVQGFVAETLGLGHAVMMVDDLVEASRFWVDVLGFDLSDESFIEIEAGELRAAFFRCNRRHHSIALAQRPPRSTASKRLLHFMIQAQDMDAVGMAFDRALDAGLRISRSLGRHPNDRMFSFYASTPAGFDAEVGWGATEADEDWEVVQYDHISAWGHRYLGVVKGQGQR